jgi:Zn finger protein HypA/HybF involved in hydrogenase expression
MSEDEDRKVLRIIYGIGQPSKPKDPGLNVAVTPMCEGDHFFEDRCNACGAAQPSGMCEVCPHMPWDSPHGHYIRRPCRACGSPNLRTQRVREAIR